MAQARRKFDEDFKQGAVRLVRQTAKPIAQVALARTVPPTVRWAIGQRRLLSTGLS